MRTAACNAPHGATYLHRLDGRVKTGVILAAVVVVSVLTSPGLVAGALLVTLTLISTLRPPAGKILRRMSIPFGVAWLVFLSLMFSTGGAVIGSIHLWRFSLPVYREGLDMGFLVMLRVLAAVSLSMLLSFSTPMAEILATLRLLRVPDIIIDLADMVYRYASTLEETAAAMRKAQLSRGGEGLPWHKRARDIGTVAGSLLVKAFDRSVRIYKAMLARGYDEDAKTPPYYTHPVPPGDIMAGSMAGLTLIALLVCNFAPVWKGWS